MHQALSSTPSTTKKKVGKKKKKSKLNRQPELVFDYALRHFLNSKSKKKQNASVKDLGLGPFGLFYQEMLQGRN